MQSSRIANNAAFVEEAIPFIIYDQEQRSNTIIIINSNLILLVYRIRTYSRVY